MSTSGNVMRLAAEELEASDRVTVINSANLSTGIGLQMCIRDSENTMFALAGKRHGWQRKGGPVMMRSTSRCV